MPTPTNQPELVCIGRTCVDLYGEQIGAPLEAVQSFQMYVGGSASNVCIGAARLGVRTAMIARVGDEPLGRFVRTTFVNENVDVRAVRFDAERLTGLITLAIRQSDDFPRIFFYENAANLALNEDDIDAELIAGASALLVTGTHFSRPNLNDASRKAIRIAKQHGTRVAFDIDYRPVLWGLAQHAQGQQMYVPSERASEHLQSILPDCDLVVGTEEELCITGSSNDLRQALAAIRARTAAAIVRKRGAQGSIVYSGPIPNDLNAGISAPAFPVEILNSTGAGDAFLAGFLSGWIRNETWETCCRFGNACGAMVVSRHGCSDAMPSRRELDYFLRVQALPPRLWEDQQLEQIHWATRRRGQWPALHVLAFDHRVQFEESVRRHGLDVSHIRAAKQLIFDAWLEVARDRDSVGALVDDQFGEKILERITGLGHWLARPIERAGVTPLEFVGGPNVGLTLKSWPREHVVKCLVFYDLHSGELLRDVQEERLLELFQACRALGRELLIEVLPTHDGNAAPFDIAAVMQRFYELGIRPDWWKIEPPAKVADWENLSQVVSAFDPDCRGVILLGKGVPLDDLRALFQIARNYPICKGFAVGRSIFHDPIENWFRGEQDQDQCRKSIEDNFRLLIDTWQSSV